MFPRNSTLHRPIFHLSKQISKRISFTSPVIFTNGRRDISIGERALQLFIFVLSLYGKDINIILCLIGYNCSTNRSLATRMNLSLLGCVSHRFNLSVDEIPNSQKNSIYCVRTIMVKFNNLIPAAKLRSHIHLGSVLDNKTRWSSQLKMWKRYISLRVSLPTLDDSHLSMLLPSAHTDHSI